MLEQGSWTRWPPEFPSNLNHSVNVIYLLMLNQALHHKIVNKLKITFFLMYMRGKSTYHCSDIWTDYVGTPSRTCRNAGLSCWLLYLHDSWLCEALNIFSVWNKGVVLSTLVSKHLFLDNAHNLTNTFYIHWKSGCMSGVHMILFLHWA